MGGEPAAGAAGRVRRDPGRRDQDPVFTLHLSDLDIEPLLDMVAEQDRPVPGGSGSGISCGRRWGSRTPMPSCASARSSGRDAAYRRVRLRERTRHHELSDEQFRPGVDGRVRFIVDYPFERPAPAKRRRRRVTSCGGTDLAPTWCGCPRSCRGRSPASSAASSRSATCWNVTASTTTRGIWPPTTGCASGTSCSPTGQPDFTAHRHPAQLYGISQAEESTSPSTSTAGGTSCHCCRSAAPAARGAVP